MQITAQTKKSLLNTDQIILSIIIPIFNKFSFTKSCLQDLSKLQDNVEIIIVDNNSTDNTYSEMLTLCDNSDMNLIYIKSEHNYGFAKACNIGYANSKSNNILFLNNDIRVKSNHNNWISIIKNSITNNNLVGPTMGQLDANLNFVQEANKILGGKSYMSGWCLAGTKEIFDKLNVAKDNEQAQIFSEEFFCYFEDTDLSFRAKQLGIEFKVVDVPVVHFGKVSSNQLNTNKLYSDARRIFVNKWKNKI